MLACGEKRQRNGMTPCCQGLEAATTKIRTAELLLSHTALSPSPVGRRRSEGLSWNLCGSSPSSSPENKDSSLSQVGTFGCYISTAALIMLQLLMATLWFVLQYRLETITEAVVSFLSR